MKKKPKSKLSFFVVVLIVDTMIITGASTTVVLAQNTIEEPKEPKEPHIPCQEGTAGPDVLSGSGCIHGNHGDDIISCNSDVRCILYGDSHNDKITGGNANDNLIDDDMQRFPELAGNDIIIGQGGNDTLQGNDGDDRLTGGPGADDFVCGDGTDTVTDFNLRENDTIKIDECESK
jgi:Ca2+-binding RTX toxin-like protein